MARLTVISPKYSLPALFLMLTGCIYEELPPCPSQVVNVEFIWDGDTPDAVDGMNIYFYPLDPDGQRWFFNIPSATGGRVELPSGQYRVIAYNANTRNIDFEQTNAYSTFYATTLYGDAKPDPSGVYQASSPDMLYGASLQEVNVEGNDTVRLRPQQYVARYNVILERIENLSAAKSISASIDGLSAGCLMHSGEKLTTNVFTPFSMTVTDTTTAIGSFLNFGYIPSESQVLTILFTLRSNKKIEFSRDVSDIISNCPTPLDVDIILSGIRVPESGDSSDTDHDTDVNVDGWKIHVVDIDVNPFI